MWPLKVKAIHDLSFVDDEEIIAFKNNFNKIDND